MNIYSIKNEKLGFFNRPIYCESDAEALSYIQNVLMSDADRALTGLKDDLALYFLGSIDFTTGVIYSGNVLMSEKLDDLSDTPIKVCSLRDIFDTIPEDKLKPALTRDDLVSLNAYVKKLEDRIEELESSYSSHSHTKKGALI